MLLCDDKTIDTTTKNLVPEPIQTRQKSSGIYMILGQKRCVNRASTTHRSHQLIKQNRSTSIGFCSIFEIDVILQRLCNDKMIDKIAPNPDLRKSDFPINPWAERSERCYKSCIDHDAESLPTSTCEIRNCCYSPGGVNIFAFSTGFGNRNC